MTFCLKQPKPTQSGSTNFFLNKQCADPLPSFSSIKKNTQSQFLNFYTLWILDSLNHKQQTMRQNLQAFAESKYTL